MLDSRVYKSMTFFKKKKKDGFSSGPGQNINKCKNNSIQYGTARL